MLVQWKDRRNLVSNDHPNLIPDTFHPCFCIREVHIHLAKGVYFGFILYASNLKIKRGEMEGKIIFFSDIFIAILHATK